MKNYTEVCCQCGVIVELGKDESLDGTNDLCEKCWHEKESQYPASVARCVSRGDYEGACLAMDEVWYGDAMI